MKPSHRYPRHAAERARSNAAFRLAPAAAIALALCLAPAAPALAYGVKGLEIVAPTQGANYVKGPVWFKIRLINKSEAVKSSDMRFNINIQRYVPAQNKWPFVTVLWPDRRWRSMDFWPYVNKPGKYRVRARRRALGVHVWSDWVHFRTGPAIMIKPGPMRKKKIFRIPKRIAPPK